jgi:hypothetical protein
MTWFHDAVSRFAQIVGLAAGERKDILRQLPIF